MSSTQARKQIYAQPGGTAVSLDIYAPDPETNCETAVLLLHGGGWAHGDKAMMAPYAATLAGHGFTPIAVQYRLTPVSPWPAQIDDVLAAIEWVRSNAAELGIRPDRIVLEGFSAGAHLSLMAGAKAKGIVAIIAFFSPSRLAVEPAGPHETPAAMLFGPEATAEQAESASPLFYINGDFPPTFLMHGNSDWMVTPASSLALYEALIAAGNTAELHIVAADIMNFAPSPPSLPQCRMRSPPS